MKRFLLLLVSLVTSFSCAQAATVYFNKMYVGSGSTYTITTKNITITTPLSCDSISFTSEDPAATNFSGNNVAGRLTYRSGGVTTTRTGVISRQSKTGSTSDLFYFVETLVTGGLITQTSTGLAIGLIVPTREAQTSNNTTVNTSSDPIDAALNTVLTSQQAQPIIGVSSPACAETTPESYAVFTVSLSVADSSGNTFTPVLNSGTATIGTDTYTGLETSTNNVAWTPLAGGGSVTIPASSTTVYIRVKIVDDTDPEGSETFTLATGTVSGGHVLNTSGAFGTATITDNDVSNTPFITAPSSITTFEDTGYSLTGSELISVADGSNNLSSVQVSVAHGTLTVTLAGGASITGTNGTASFSITGNQTDINATLASLSYQGGLNYNGSDTLSLLATDASTNTGTASVSITVTPVNDAPSFTKGANQTVNENTGAHTVTSWATTLSAGPFNESSQALSFNVSNDNNSLFSVQPAISATGTLTYTLASHQYGSATVTVSISDDGGILYGGVDTSATQTFTITSSILPPVAGELADGSSDPNYTQANSRYEITTPENAAYNGQVHAYEPSLLTLSYTKASNPSHGTVTVNADGTYSYSPATNFYGNDQFTVTADNGQGGTVTITVYVTVTMVVYAPVGGKLSDGSNDLNYNSSNGRYEVTTPENTPYSSQVHAYSRNGFSLTYAKASNPSHGTGTVNSDGSYTYTPATNYYGNDQFTLSVDDGHGGTTTITVYITVTMVVYPPVGGELSDGSKDPAYTLANGRYEISTAENTTHNGQVHAYSQNGLSLTYAKASNPSHGTVTVNSDGSYTYTPASNYYGNDQFTVSVDDGHGGTTTITVRVTVTLVVYNPVGGKLSDGTDDPAYNLPNARYEFTIAENSSRDGQVRAYDKNGFPLSYATNTTPVHGTVTVNADGTYTYTPAANFYGTDDFTVQVTNDHFGAAIISVHATVTMVAYPPVGGRLSNGSNDPTYTLANARYEVTTPENTACNGQVHAYSQNGFTLACAKASDPSHGTVAVNADGSYTYTPASNFYGTDDFTISVDDGHGGTTSISVHVTVTMVVYPPVPGRLSDGGNDPSYNLDSGHYDILTPENAAYEGDVHAYSRNGFTLAYAAGSNPSHGTATVNGDGTYTYTPSTNYYGNDQFTISVDDGHGGSATISVHVIVNLIVYNPVGGKLGDGSDDPAYNFTAVRYEITTPENTAYTGQVRAYDKNSFPLNFSTNTTPLHGSAVVRADGTYAYTPTANFFGTDDFTVQVVNDHYGVAIIKVHVTVTLLVYAPVGGRLSDRSQDPAYNLTNARYEASTRQDTAYAGRVHAYSQNGFPLSYGKDSSPTHGSVVVNTDGTYTYTPATGYYGHDSFTIRVDDGHGGSTLITVYVTVNAPPVNSLPKGQLSFTGAAATVIGTDGSTFSVSDADSTELTVTLGSLHGLLSLPVRTGLTLVAGTGLNDAIMTVHGRTSDLNIALAKLTYQAESGYFGTDIITILSEDPTGLTDLDSLNPPMGIELSTLGGTSLSNSLTSVANPGKTLVDASVSNFDPKIISGASISGTGANATLQIGTPTLQDGSVQHTTVTVTLNYSDGTSETTTLKVTVYNPQLTFVTQLSLNPQTSLYEQQIKVTNTTPYYIKSYRVLIPALPTGASVYTRTTTFNGQAAIEDNQALNPGESRTLTIQYYAPTLANFADPAVTLQINQTVSTVTPIGTIAAVDRVVTGASNRSYIEFATVSGKTYWVQYRDSSTGDWLTSPTPIVGTGTAIDWLDDGFPMTLSAPTPARQYRLLVTVGTVAQLTVATQPKSVTPALGGSASLGVTMGAGGPYAYQWYKDGVAVTGATASSFSVSKVTLDDEGDYYVIISDGKTSLQSAVSSITLQSDNPGRIANLSVRAQLDAAGSPLITGLVLSGTGSKPVLMRVVGSGLTPFGVSTAAKDTLLKLYSGSTLLDQNDDWSSDAAVATTRSASALTGAFGLKEGSTDAAMVRNLMAQPYTLHAINKGSTAGIGLIEVYDAQGSYTPSSRITNLSARAPVSSGEGVLIAGVVILGETSTRVMIRAVGPTLDAYGITNPLADPVLSVYAAGSTTPLATNDDWSASQATILGEGLFAKVGAFNLPLGSKDSVIVTRLKPGAYSFMVQGKAGAQGQALIEVYLVE
jgi:hypothetical protein